MKIILFIALLFSLVSCSLYMKKSRQLGEDYKYLSSEAFAQKYFTLYKTKNKISDSTFFDKVYYVSQNNARASYVSFNKNNFTYESNPFDVHQQNNISNEETSKPFQIKRADYYSIQDSIIKIESIAQSSGDVYTIIREGIINNDKITLLKKYNSGSWIKKDINKEWTNIDNLKVYQLGEDFYVGLK
ncbi:hypothetical protein ERX46_10110 [Brumimicrobium glaciale]|uniref:Lipoprotein n=1 Tax=Brumimicrobium glaciale TaxID=200475 RepID=A0A4Q4KK96_9FLAO|nr:hypothetical protein [Brumimicrobium glaciale]RYM33290.1 hypothetical protein ERX46_10110 [Brumimicrobium glaciale]